MHHNEATEPLRISCGVAQWQLQRPRLAALEVTALIDDVLVLAETVPLYCGRHLEATIFAAMESVEVDFVNALTMEIKADGIAVQPVVTSTCPWSSLHNWYTTIVGHTPLPSQGQLKSSQPDGGLLAVHAMVQRPVLINIRLMVSDLSITAVAVSGLQHSIVLAFTVDSFTFCCDRSAEDIDGGENGVGVTMDLTSLRTMPVGLLQIPEANLRGKLTPRTESVGRIEPMTLAGKLSLSQVLTCLSQGSLEAVGEVIRAWSLSSATSAVASNDCFADKQIAFAVNMDLEMMAATLVLLPAAESTTALICVTDSLQAQITLGNSLMVPTKGRVRIPLTRVFLLPRATVLVLSTEQLPIAIGQKAALCCWNVQLNLPRMYALDMQCPQIQSDADVTALVGLLSLLDECVIATREIWPPAQPVQAYATRSDWKLDANFETLSLAISMGSSQLFVTCLAVSCSGHQQPDLPLTLSVGKITATFNAAPRDILEMNQLQLTYWVELPLALAQRYWSEKSEHTPLKNTAILISVTDVTVWQPYQFCLAHRLEDLKCTYKLVKQILAARTHDRLPQATPTGQNKALVLIMNIRGPTQLQFLDDLFESKLDLNYRLLADEVREQQKRHKVLQAKIEALREQPSAALSTQRVEELYDALEIKNAEIYCARARDVHANAAYPPLACFLVDGLTLLLQPVAAWKSDKEILQAIADLSAPAGPGPEHYDLLLGRQLTAQWREITCRLRDYPTSLLTCQAGSIQGLIIVTEPQAQPCSYSQTAFAGFKLQRSMSPLKVYHDLQLSCGALEVAHGPAYVPVLQKMALCAELLTKASDDPSAPLPWFDKLRWLRHGRLKVCAERVLYSVLATRDPHATIDRMNVTILALKAELSNGHATLSGDTQVQLLPPTKFYRVPLLDLPHFEATLSWQWQCAGDPLNHHRPVLHASENVKDIEHHDSFAGFRSTGLCCVIELQAGVSHDAVQPACLLYAGTVKWLTKAMRVLTQQVAPVGRRELHQQSRSAAAGRNNSLGQHLTQVELVVGLQHPTVIYHNSYERRDGARFSVAAISWSAFYRRAAAPQAPPLLHHHRQIVNPELLRRAQVRPWATVTSVGELQDVVGVVMQPHNPPEETQALRSSFLVHDLQTLAAQDMFDGGNTAAVHHLLSSSRISYQCSDNTAGVYRHNFDVVHLRLAWTEATREVVRSIYRAYAERRSLHFDLSRQALQAASSNDKDSEERKASQPTSPDAASSGEDAAYPPRRLKRMPSLLTKLLADATTNFTGIHEPTCAQPTSSFCLEKLGRDILDHEMILRLQCPQIGMVGPETGVPITVTAESTEICFNTHRTVRRRGKLDCKDSWSGTGKHLQFFTTSSRGGDDSMLWIPPVCLAPDPETGRVIDPTSSIHRMVPGCGAQFSYVRFYHDPEASRLVDPRAVPLEEQDGLLAANAYLDTVHVALPQLELKVMPAQWAAVNDVLFNLCFMRDTTQQENIDRLETMKYRAKLTKQSEDQRTAVVEALQNRVRSYINQLDDIERELMVVGGASAASHTSKGELRPANDSSEEIQQRAWLHLAEEWGTIRRMLRLSRRELRLRVESLQAFLLNGALQDASSEDPEMRQLSRTVITLERGHWRLLTAAGTAMVRVEMRQLEYCRLSATNGSGDNRMELGDVRMVSELAGERYVDVLGPFRVSDGFRRGPVIRVFSREGVAIGGIPVKEHFEVNAVPLLVQLSKRLYGHFMAYFFPGSEEAVDEAGQEAEFPANVQVPAAESTEPGRRPSLAKKDLDGDLPAASASAARATRSGTIGQGRRQTVSKKQPPEVMADVDRMRARAQSNRTFIYVKIPSTLVCVSYKGDQWTLHERTVTLPNFEYHSRTCTWLEMLAQIKADLVRHIVGQVMSGKVSSGAERNEAGRYDPSAVANRPDGQRQEMLMGRTTEPAAAPQPRRSVVKTLLPKSFFGGSKLKAQPSDLDEAEAADTMDEVVATVDDFASTFNDLLALGSASTEPDAEKQ